MINELPALRIDIGGLKTVICVDPDANNIGLVQWRDYVMLTEAAARQLHEWLGRALSVESNSD